MYSAVAMALAAYRRLNGVMAAVVRTPGAKIVADGGQLVFEEVIPAAAVDDRNLASDPVKERFSIKLDDAELVPQNLDSLDNICHFLETKQKKT